jgi:DnaJ-domain-containing protein 1
MIGETLFFNFYPLRNCGIKAILLIKFDVMAGPYIAFEGICGESKVVETLKDPITLAQFHMGLAETDVDVIEKQGERMVIARRKRLIEGIEAKDILMLIIEDDVSSDEATKLADELLGRTGGDQNYLRNELRKLCDNPHQLKERLELPRHQPLFIKKSDLMKEAGTKIPVMTPEQKDKVLKGEIASQLVNDYPMDLITNLVQGVNNKITVLSLWKLYSPVNTDLLEVYELFTSLNALEVCRFEEALSFFTRRL